MRETVNAAVEILRKGGIIIYPTDTVWGIGCDATNEAAVSKIYELKRSTDKRSMIVLCADLDMAVRYISRPLQIAFEVMELATKPTTVIMPGGVGVAANLIPEEGTLAIRVPDHEFCRALIKRLGRPLVSTSVNISGEAAAKRLKEVSSELIDGVDMVIHPKFEGSPTRQPSSIISFGADSSFKIIRE